MVRADSDGKYGRHAALRRSPARPACGRRTPPGRGRGRSAARRPGRPAVPVSRCAARNTCRIRGPGRRRRSRPGRPGRTGTSRQPSTSAALDERVLLHDLIARARASPSSSAGRPGRWRTGRPAAGRNRRPRGERVRDLDHDAGAVAGVVLRAPGAPVVEPASAPTGPWPPRRGSGGRAGRPRRPHHRRRARAPGRRARWSGLRGRTRGGLVPGGADNATGPPVVTGVHSISRSGRRRPCVGLTESTLRRPEHPPVRIDHTSTHTGTV